MNKQEFNVGDRVTDHRAPAQTPATPPKPTRTFSPKSQNGKLLAYLAAGNRVTRIIADHMFNIASLTRRICDLKDAGHKIEGQTKIDPRGNPYVEYKLASKPQRRVG